ncbi:MAG: tetratricopeptide repeat protein [Methylophilaceae bacterium]
MKKIAKLLVLLFCMSTFICYAASQKNDQAKVNQETQDGIRQLQQDSRTLSHDIEILRRDQVNYSIEKSLLKESFSANMERINVVITLFLGIFGVLGFLGIRSIKEIKIDYTNELDKLRTVKLDFESQLLSFRTKQIEFESQVEKLIKSDTEQDTRLKVLELVEKANSIMGSKNWGWALEFINVGLELDPNNIQLLTYKAKCHAKSGEFSASIETSKKILEIQPKSTIRIINLLELLAITTQAEEFNKVYTQHKQIVDDFENGSVIVYLNALKNLMTGLISEASEDLINFAKACDHLPKPLLGPWDFDEVMIGVSNLPQGKQKELLNKTVQLFQGAIPPTEFITALQQP